ISMAAKRGIIIKDPAVLEMLPVLKTAIFDKTGTLTYGQPKLSDVMVADGFVADDILRMVASLEQYSKHPLAQAIINAALQKNLYWTETKNVTEEPGMGLLGDVGGQSIQVTSRQKVLEHNPSLSAVLPATTLGLECVIMVGGVYAATFIFRDEPRRDSQS